MGQVLPVASKMTDAQLKEAAELYQRGWSSVQISEYFSFDQSTVWCALKRMGVQMRRPWQR